MGQSQQYLHSDNLENFNTSGEDQMGLGRTPSVRSAELVAGARAELMRDREIFAMSRIAGRIATKMIGGLAGSKASNHVLWFFPARMIALEALTQRLQPDYQKAFVLVDVASGLSTRGLRMARQYPNARVIEVDLPSMVEEKQKRLKIARIDMPHNLTWMGADLGKENLIDVLQGQQADLITCEGLTLYLSEGEMLRLFQQLYAALTAGGHIIVDGYSRARMNDLRRSSQLNSAGTFIMRIVGNVPGFLPDLGVMDQWMRDAGLTDVTTYNLAGLMRELHQTEPIDYIDIKTAQRPDPTRSAVSSEHD